MPNAGADASTNTAADASTNATTPNVFHHTGDFVIDNTFNANNADDCLVDNFVERDQFLYDDGREFRGDEHPWLCGPWHQ